MIRFIIALVFLMIIKAIVVSIVKKIRFRIKYSKPLTSSEIEELASKRRMKKINEYYRFSRREIKVDKKFKSSMNPEGQYYKVNKNLNEFPVYAAALLKYKKHQWMILGFAENKKVKLMWVNKGDNKKSVTLALSSQEMVKKAVNLKCDTVLRFHNHPNPRKHNLSRPGRYDKKTCQKYGDLLARNSINYLDFVCKEGLPYKFDEKYPETFIPQEEFIDNIKVINGKSKSENLKLHKERLSTKL